MLKARATKNAYTGLSLLDLGFSSRILEKYGFFSDYYLTGLSLVFRKDKAHKGTGGTVVYRNIINHTLGFRFFNIGRNSGVVSTSRWNEVGDYNSPPVWSKHRQKLQGSFNTPLQRDERHLFTSLTGTLPFKEAGDIFSLRYNSYYLDNYLPRPISRRGQPEESGSVNREPIRPGLRHIKAWYLKLQKYLKPENHTFPAGNPIYTSLGEDGKRLPGKWAGSPTILRRRHDGRSTGSWAGTEAGRTESVSRSGTEIKPVQYINQTQAGSIFSRSLVRFDIGRQNYAIQQIKTELFNITRNLHAEFMNYKTEKPHADYVITPLDNSHNAPDRRAKDMNTLTPGHLQRYRSERPSAEYHRWLEWYQISSWNRIQRAEVELAFERQVLEHHRQKLTNGLNYLSLEINKNKPDRQVPDFGQKSAARLGRNPGPLTYTQRRLQEKTRLKRELRRISELLSVQEKSAAGDNQITGRLPGSPLELGLPENHVMLGRAEITDTIQLPEPSNTRRGSSTAGLGAPKPEPDHGLPETENSLINRGRLNLTGPGTAADRIFLQNLRYDRLLNQKNLQQTAIWRKEQQLLKVMEIQDYMNLQRRQLKRDPAFSFNIKRFLTNQNSPNLFDRYETQQDRYDFLINKNFYRYGKTSRLTESLNRLEELIRNEYWQQDQTRTHREKARKGEPFALIDKKITSKPELYDFQAKTTGGLRLAEPYSSQSRHLPAQHRKWSRPGRFEAEVIESEGLAYLEKPPEFKQNISPNMAVPLYRKLNRTSRFITEVMERGQIMQSYRERESTFYQKEIRSQEEFWQAMESGRIGYAGKQPEIEPISKGEPGFRLYTKQTVATEEKKRKKTDYLMQDNILDYQYDSKRFRKKSTNLSIEVWDRIRYNPKVTKLWSRSATSTVKIPGNTTIKASPGIEQILETAQLHNHTGSSIRQVPVSREESGIPPGIMARGNMNLERMKSGKLDISRKAQELTRLHRMVPVINAPGAVPEDISKYSPMDFHRQVREPDFERDRAKTGHEEIINDQVYRYEGDIKIDPANMERIVNNVYNEIERRLEFERQRRGL